MFGYCLKLIIGYGGNQHFKTTYRNIRKKVYCKCIILLISDNKYSYQIDKLSNIFKFD